MLIAAPHAGSPASVRLFLFGRVRLTFDGEPRKLAALPRALPLLALVAVRGTQPQQREALAYALWPDEDERDARANLRRHIHSVRKALPPACDPFVVDDVHIAWNPVTALWCDVVAFERERAEKRFDAALELYGGPLLDDSIEERICAERERLQNVFVTLGIERSRAARSAGDLERAIALAQRVAEADPWREDVVRALMEMRLENGDRASALDTFDRFARRLAHEMNVGPMAETLALRARIASARGAEPAQAASNGRRAGATAVELRFVERERELGELEATPVAFVVGEAGIGKSRLLAEFAKRCEARGTRVALGAVPAGGERSPYRPLVAALQPFAAWLQTNLDAPRAELLRSLFDPAAAEGGERAQVLVFDAFAAAFEAIAREGPLALLIEDAHWAGEATAAALGFLARRLARSQIAFAVTYRSEALGHAHPIGRMARELVDDGAAGMIAVRRLSEDGVRAAIEGAVPDAARASALAGELARISEGNPFFLGEVLRDRLESPDGEFASGSVEDVIEARLERLDDRARALLEVAASVGDVFALDLARTSAGMNESDARAAIDELLDRQIVRDGGRRLGYRFAFAHHLIRTHVYETMPAGVRGRRHLRVATVLEKRAGDAPADVAADLAHHFDRGGDHERAARYCLQAARRFARVGAFDEAVAHAERGIALARDPELRFDLLLAREAVAEARGNRDRQAEILDAAEALAPELGDDARTFDLLVRRIVNLRARGLRLEEASAVERLVALARALHDPVRDAEALMQRASTSVFLGTRDPRDDLTQAIRLLDAAGDARARVRAHCDAIVTLAGLRRPLEQAELLAAARRISAESNDPECEIAVLEAAVTANYLPDPSAAIADAERLIPILAARGERERLAELYRHVAGSCNRVGRYGRALEYCARGRRLFLELGKPHSIGAIANVVGTAKICLGRADEAMEQFDSAYELFVGLHDPRGKSVARNNRAYVCLQAGDYEAGIRAGEHALDLAREAEHPALMSIAWANIGANCLWLGDIPRALEALRASLPASGIGSVVDSVDDLAQYCVALVRAGRNDDAARVADDILEVRAKAGEAHMHDHFAAYAVSLARDACGDAAGARAALLDARDALERFFIDLDPEADRAGLAAFTENAAVLRALEASGLRPSAAPVAADARRTAPG